MFESPLASHVLSIINSLLATRFLPRLEVPAENLRGRTAIVTGANTGIGLECARKLAGMGAHVVLACRDVEKGAAAQKDILSDSALPAGLVTVEELDLSNGRSVQVFIERWGQRPLDILINNAGMSSAKYLHSKNTSRPFELLYYVNILSHIQLTLGLLPVLAPGARIVNWGYAVGDTWKVPQCAEIHGRVKLMAVMFSKELQIRLDRSERYAAKNITVYSCHPGLVKTTIHYRSDGAYSVDLTAKDRTFLTLVDKFAISSEQGACTPVYIAVVPGVLSDKGGYFDRLHRRTPNRLVTDAKTRAGLWDEWMRQLEIKEKL